MSRRIFEPKTRQENERLLPPIVQQDFSGGMWRDIPVLPDNAVANLQNFINFGNRLEARSGTRVYSDTTLPAVNTTYTASKNSTVITKTSGTDFSTSDLGRYFVHDDGCHDLIMVVTGVTTVKVNSDTSHNASSAGWTRNPVHCLFFHEGAKKILMHIGDKLYIADDLSLSGWTEIYKNCNTSLPTNAFIQTTAQTAASNSFTAASHGLSVGDKIKCWQSNGTLTSVGLVRDITYTVATTADANTFTLSGVSFSSDGTQKVAFQTASGMSQMSELGDFVIIFTRSGIFKVNVTDTYPVYYQINDSTPTMSLTTAGSGNYKRRYTYAMSRLSGLTDWTSDRTTSGVEIEQESGTCTPNTEYVDYNEMSYSVALSSSNTSSVSACVLPTNAYQWSHYSLYGTLDTGDNGVDPVTGEGNNPELYMWLADLPVVKAFVASASGTTVTATSGKFTQWDIGSSFFFGDGTNSRITGYTSSTVVTVANDLGTVTSQSGVIGTTNSVTASQSGTTVTATAGSNFTSTMVGQTLFWTDGNMSVVTAFTDTTHVIVADSTTRSSTGAAWGASSRYFCDIIPDDAADKTTPQLRARAAGYTLQQRYWQPMSGDAIGCVVPGFMFSADENDERIDYCQLPESCEYLIGYHNSYYQFFRIKDGVRAMLSLTDKLIVFGARSTHEVPTNVWSTIDVPEVGESVVVISGQSELDDTIGVLSRGSIQLITRDLVSLITHEPAHRLFDGSSYSDNLSEGRIGNDLRSYQHDYSSSYDPENGYQFWAISGNGRQTDVCFRYATRPTQGIEYAENTGISYVFPEPETGTLQIFDDNNQKFSLVLDFYTGLFYNISTRDSFTGAESRVWKDAVQTDDSGGTDIAPVVLFPEDRAPYEHQLLEHRETYIYTRPKSASDGYATNISFDVDIYEDGEPSTTSATSLDIQKGTEICYDRAVTANRLQTKVTADMSQFSITGRQQYYVVKDIPTVPANRITNEGSCQATVRPLVCWFTRGPNLDLDRISNTDASVTYTATTGPDTYTTSAMSFTSAINLGEVSPTTEWFVMWYGTMSLSSVTIGGVVVTMTSYNTYGTWTLGYNSGAFTAGDLIITPNITGKIFDIRFIAASAASDLLYLYNDLVYNHGNATLPFWG